MYFLTYWKFPCLRVWPAALCWKNDGHNWFFANISETIYCTEVNIQIKNKQNWQNSPQFGFFNEPCTTNNSENRFFQGSLIFEHYVNLFIFRTFFVNIINLTASTYETYGTKSKEYSIICKINFYWILCDQYSSGDIIFLKILWFVDIMRMRHFLR